MVQVFRPHSRDGRKRRVTKLDPEAVAAEGEAFLARHERGDRTEAGDEVVSLVSRMAAAIRRLIPLATKPEDENQ